jgi:hypothetical protein
MKDDRKRISLSREYAQALGVATYCFAACEWNVAWCCERINPGVLNKIMDEELTAGKIGWRFKNLTRNMPPSQERIELEVLAADFLRLVELRNGILHGKPCTAPSGEQRLSSGEKIWDLTDLERAADEFAECSSKLNSYLHGFLSTFSALP